MISFGEFVAARHALWLDKTYGVPAQNFAPQEHIDQLRSHHLTNVWRELDRGTLHVINDLQLPALNSYLAVHRTLIYRFFNSYNGYNRYHETVRQPAHPTVAEINEILDQPGNFSGAYIRTIKRDTAILALQTLYRHAEVVSELLDTHHELDDAEAIVANRKAIRDALGKIPSFGMFLADQLMLDFAWHGNPWSLAEFRPSLGPGAKRGLERLGVTFAEAKREAEEALETLPRPRVLISMGIMEYAQVPVPLTYVEIEHQLCEAEKLWKLNDAIAEGEGRQVKMRKYRAIDSSREQDSKPKIKPLPVFWADPKF